MADETTHLDLEVESESNDATLELQDDTAQHLDLELEEETEEATLSLSDDDTERYLDLSLENQIDVVDTGGGSAVYDGALVINQGNETKARFTANSKVDVVANIDEYIHPTTAGNLHVPAGGEENQYLAWEGDGVAKWTAGESQVAENSQALVTSGAVYTAIQNAIVEVENGTY